MYCTVILCRNGSLLPFLFFPRTSLIATGIVSSCACINQSYVKIDDDSARDVLLFQLSRSSMILVLLWLYCLFDFYRTVHVVEI